MKGYTGYYCYCKYKYWLLCCFLFYLSRNYPEIVEIFVKFLLKVLTENNVNENNRIFQIDFYNDNRIDTLKILACFAFQKS